MVISLISKILIDVYEESKRQRFKRNTRIGKFENSFIHYGAKHFFNCFLKEMIGIDLVCEMVKCMATLVGLFMYLILSFDVVCLLKRKYENIYIYIYMSYMY